MLYWVGYYLEKGFKLEYLLSLGELEKLFFIHSMYNNKKEQVNYDTEKLKALAKMIGG